MLHVCMYTLQVSKKAQETAERLSDQAEAIGKTDIYKTVSKVRKTGYEFITHVPSSFPPSFSLPLIFYLSLPFPQGAETVKEDLLDDIIKESSPYKPPGGCTILIKEHHPSFLLYSCRANTEEK